jgi:hypothetical protein
MGTVIAALSAMGSALVASYMLRHGLAIAMFSGGLAAIAVACMAAAAAMLMRPRRRPAAGVQETLRVRALRAAVQTDSARSAASALPAERVKRAVNDR